MQPHHRRSVRIAGHDYSEAGYYFVTLCTHDRNPLFGKIRDQRLISNHLGDLVESCWKQIPKHFAHVALDAFVLMPNHLHGIIISRGMTCHAPTDHTPANGNPEREFGQPRAGSLASMVGSFKAAVTRIWFADLSHSRAPIWQCNYFEHIIRSEAKLIQIRKYIETNPARWTNDEYYAENNQT